MREISRRGAHCVTLHQFPETFCVSGLALVNLRRLVQGLAETPSVTPQIWARDSLCGEDKAEICSTTDIGARAGKRRCLWKFPFFSLFSFFGTSSVPEAEINSRFSGQNANLLLRRQGDHNQGTELSIIGHIKLLVYIWPFTRRNHIITIRNPVISLVYFILNVLRISPSGPA